ncbi:MAG: hypothetical protein BMS9Abin28_2227 [Anaerolineae bacterium]|nr:MAG: hypothetical protein BMS9Abin28_2227 [Anaerolineae bacterium]
MLAHGAVLRKNVFGHEQLVAIVKDFRNAGLPADEVAVMALAQKVSIRANDVSQDDIEELRMHGLSDEEIMDVVLTAAARSFFSRTLDALGARPDEVYKELEPELVEVLTVGRAYP